MVDFNSVIGILFLLLFQSKWNCYSVPASEHNSGPSASLLGLPHAGRTHSATCKLGDGVASLFLISEQWHILQKVNQHVNKDA